MKIPMRSKMHCNFIKKSRYDSAFLFILDQNKENVKKTLRWREKDGILRQKIERG